jgi:hypothetical protein
MWHIYWGTLAGTTEIKSTMKNSRLIAAAGLLAVSLVSTVAIRATEDAPPPLPAQTKLAGLHDFDFLVGEWHVHHFRLKDRLADSHEWVEFDGTCALRPTMGGWGNVDDNVLNLPGGAYRAMGLRAYDPKTGQWAIWWADGRNPFGDLDPPVKGRFQDGVGTFFADDTLRGKPIRVRFTWSRITPTSAHWEQAFSPDGGKTWETNWKMDFTRVN